MPAATTTRWTPTRKAAVVAEIATGKITFNHAVEHYGLGADELRDWMERDAKHGTHGLSVTRRQQVR